MSNLDDQIAKNKELEEKVAALEAEKTRLSEEKKQIFQEAHPYDGLPEEQDGRHRLVTIMYGRRRSGVDTQGNPASTLMKETLPLDQAFERLVNYYSFFTKVTDRNVPKEYGDINGQPQLCNNFACYIKKEFKDALQRSKTIILRKEVPLWLAVDDVVQKGQKVELITIKEWDEFLEDEFRKEIHETKEYQDKKRQEMVNRVMEEEMASK